MYHPEKQSNESNTLWWKKEKGSRLTDRANENLKLSHSGPNQRQASGNNRPIKLLRQGRHRV